MENLPDIHGIYMENTWYLHEKHMVSTWETHGIYMGNTWYLHGKHMVLTWETHDIYLGNTWYLRRKHKGYMQDTYGTHIISQINPIWVLCFTHFHFLYGSHMGTPYKTHIDGHMKPIWVPYTSAVWADTDRNNLRHCLHV